jgi:hypothetical protein
MTVRYQEKPLFPDMEMESERLCETAPDFLAEAQLDRETHIVRNVALLGPESKNGYRYTSEAMQNAAALYEGRPVFIDHAEATRHGHDCGQLAPRVDADSRSESATLPQRSLRDYAGKVVNPRFENQRVRGDLHLIGPNADWLLSLFEASPSDIGMSHVVLARRNSAGDEVAKIEKVVSVDIVAFPATVQSFRESGQLAPRVDDRLAERVGHLAATPCCSTCLLRRQESKVQIESETPRSTERDSGRSPITVRRALITAIRGE